MQTGSLNNFHASVLSHVTVDCEKCLLVTYCLQFLGARNSFFYYLALFSFDGRVVAKLPFVPLSYIQGLSHRNLLGEDYTDCSFIFLYILCTMSIRQVCSAPKMWWLDWSVKLMAVEKVKSIAQSIQLYCDVVLYVTF